MAPGGLQDLSAALCPPLNTKDLAGCEPDEVSFISRSLLLGGGRLAQRRIARSPRRGSVGLGALAVALDRVRPPG